MALNRKIVHQVWSTKGGSTHHQPIEEKLKAVGEAVQCWYRGKYGGLKHEIKKKQGRLSTILARELNRETLEELSINKQDLDALLEKEESYWAQRARLTWIHVELRHPFRIVGFLCWRWARRPSPIGLSSGRIVLDLHLVWLTSSICETLALCVRCGRLSFSG
ncbi:hypothetical protein Droror1_Dr00009106 [Drosera rotundifolia]